MFLSLVKPSVTWASKPKPSLDLAPGRGVWPVHAGPRHPPSDHQRPVFLLSFCVRAAWLSSKSWKWPKDAKPKEKKRDVASRLEATASRLEAIAITFLQHPKELNKKGLFKSMICKAPCHRRCHRYLDRDVARTLVCHHDTHLVLRSDGVSLRAARMILRAST